MSNNLQVITEQKEIYTSVKAVVPVDVIVCTDGKRFDIAKRAQAEFHQKSIDEMTAFKEAIKYTEIDGLTLCEHYESGYRKTFTFEWDANMPIEQKKLMARIVESDMVEYRTIESGKYLVIEYYQYHDNSNGADWETSDGYFGTIPDYIKMLEGQIQKAKAL